MTTIDSPVFDLVKSRQDAINRRTSAIDRTSELFGNGADIMWAEDKPLELANLPEGTDWKSLMEFVGASLMLMMEDKDYASTFFPEDEVGQADAIRRGELRSIGFAMACQSLALLEAPVWVEE